MNIAGVQFAGFIFANTADVQNTMKMNIGLLVLNIILSQLACIREMVNEC